MADPLTTNIQLAVPLRATDVGTWDVPVNGDFTIIDQCFGGVQTYALNNSNVNVTVSQAQNSVIRLTGTLTSSVSIILSSGFAKFWIIDNQLTNPPSSYSAVLVSSGSQQIGIPPGQQDVFYDGSNVYYRNLGRIGEYWDYAGATVPNWVTNSTVPPYLNCTGTTFSSGTYPVLYGILGGTTLPDARGRFRAALNQTTGRLTTAGGGVDGNTLNAAGGNQTVTLGTSQIPANIPGQFTSTSAYIPGYGAGQIASGGGSGAIVVTSSAVGSFAALSLTVTGSLTINSSVGGGSHANVPPTYIGGITMIRAG